MIKSTKRKLFNMYTVVHVRDIINSVCVYIDSVFMKK